MNTFLPYHDFQQSIEALDPRRLGKQRVEGKQILKILLGDTQSNAWANHPAVLQWEGYEYALARYVRYCCRRWRQLGYVDNIHASIDDMMERFEVEDTGMPSWLGDPDFHLAHRSKLMFKGRKDVLAYTIKQYIIDREMVQPNGRRLCVQGWLRMNDCRDMNTLKIEAVKAIEERLEHALGRFYVKPMNHYACLGWTVSDNDEFDYIWPSHLTTA